MKSSYIYILIAITFTLSSPAHADICSAVLGRAKHIADTISYRLRSGLDKEGAIRDFHYVSPLPPELIEYMRSMDSFSGTRYHAENHTFRGYKVVGSARLFFLFTDKTVILGALDDMSLKPKIMTWVRKFLSEYKDVEILDFRETAESPGNQQIFSIDIQGRAPSQVRFIKALDEGLRLQGRHE